METFIEGNGLQEKEEKSMKKCTICEREVDDYIQKCPHCGHDFNFVYDKDPVAFEERFEAPDYYKVSIMKYYLSLAFEYYKEDVEDNSNESKSDKAILNIKSIRERTAKEEERVFHLELKNRNYLLLYFSVLNAITMAFVLLVRKELFFQVELYLSIFFVIVSVFLICVVKKMQTLVKIVQDFALAIIFTQFSYAILFCLMRESIGAIMRHYGYTFIGILIAVIYYKKVGKTYPICVPAFLFGAYEMISSSSKYRIYEHASDEKKAVLDFVIFNGADLVFALLAGGFFAVFILDIIHYIKTRKSSHVS